MNDFKKEESSLYMLALERIAKIFNLPLDQLKEDYRFGVDLKASSVSDFKDNEFDQVNNDIHDVADKQSLKDMKFGKLVINTVGEYCKYIELSFETNPKSVKAVLGI